MSKHDWQRDRTRFERNVAEFSIDARPVLSNASGSILMARASFSEFEGEFQLTPRLMISLCLSGSGRLRRSTELGSVEGMMRPGTFALALPHTQGDGTTPAADMLGLSIGASELESFGLATTGADLIPAASAIRNDPLISSVMRAIWLDAEAHGMSSLFFQHGVAVILQRLADMQAPALPDAYLTTRRLERARDLLQTDDSFVSEGCSLRHCEERSDAAIQRPRIPQDLDCFVARAPRNDGEVLSATSIPRALNENRPAMRHGRLKTS